VIKNKLIILYPENPSTIVQHWPRIYILFPNLDINSSKADFGAAFYGDKIIFTSARDSTSLSKCTVKEPFLNLYAADRNSNDGKPVWNTFFAKCYDEIS
jgi:hypothetical protein